MQQYKLDKDLLLVYITADSFPDGVLAAHQKLHGLVPFSTQRKYFRYFLSGCKWCYNL